MGLAQDLLLPFKGNRTVFLLQISSIIVEQLVQDQHRAKTTLVSSLVSVQPSAIPTDLHRSLLVADFQKYSRHPKDR